MKNKSIEPISGYVSDSAQERIPFSRRQLVIFILTLLTILLVGSMFFHMMISKTPKDIAFTIDGKNYSQKEIQRLSDYPINLDGKSPRVATKEIYNYMQYRAAAEAIGIRVEKSQLQEFRKQQGHLIYKQANYEDYLNLVAFKNKTEESILSDEERNKNGHFEGYLFTFHFDETLTNAPAYRSPHYGDRTLYDRDKKYAQDKAGYYYTQLKQHKIAADKALAEIKADKQLGYYYAPNTNDSVKFGAHENSDWQLDVYHPEIADYIKLQTKTGLSAVQKGRISAVPNPQKDDDYVDGYRYFVLLTKVQPNSKEQGPALQQSMKKVQEHSKYYGDPHA